MNAKKLANLRRDAREAELQMIERNEPGGLHITFIGDRVVHWWPDSKRQTAYVEGSSAGIPYVAHDRVIKIAASGGKRSEE